VHELHGSTFALILRQLSPFNISAYTKSWMESDPTCPKLEALVPVGVKVVVA